MKKSHIILTCYYLLLSILFTACNSTKYVKENEYLLSKNTIKIDNKKSSDFNITDYLIQRPNNKPLGIPVGLYVYNLGNLDYDTIHQKRIKGFEERNTFWDRVLSKKQTLKSINSRDSLNNWFLTKGEKPVIVDDKKTAITAKKLRKHFFNNGYFNAIVNTKLDSKNKKAKVSYNVKKNKPYVIGDISYFISSEQVDTIVKQNKDKIFVKKGDQYSQENIIKTVDALTKVLRDNGFFHFSEGLISFRNIDTLAKNNITPVELHIKNRSIQKRNRLVELPTEIQRITKIEVFTDYSYEKRNKAYTIKEDYENISYFAHDKLKHSIKSLSNSIFIKPGDIYSDESINATRKHLKSLNNFKTVKITHIELPNNELETKIVLTPLNKYTAGIDAEIIHSNIKQVGISGGLSFVNRNLFKGSEIFKIGLQGSVFNTSTSLINSESNNLDAYEIGIDASLELPKLIFPFMTNIIPRSMTPRTKITIGTSFQENIGLDKQKFTGIIDYTWKPSTTNKHVIELANAQFIRNLNIDSYFNIYSSEYNKIKEIQEEYFPSYNLNTTNAVSFISGVDSTFKNSNPTEYNTIQNIEERRDIITSNNIIPAASYSYEYNSKKSLSDTRYTFFKGKITSSGNVNSFLFETQNDQKVFKNIPLSQYIKFDLDFRKFWSTSTSNSIAFRTFIGVAIPTWQTTDIPFISSYYAGGSNDLRAWKTYELGPGSTNTGLEFNIGNLKILSSLEYRFKIFNSMHGAIFADAGNIWNLPNSSSTASDEELFSGIESLENIALGTGFGVRYNFSFLVLRLDLAFKTYEPYLTENKWLNSYTLGKSVLNIGINYPF